MQDHVPEGDSQGTTLTTRELSFGYWVATHRVLLHNLVVGFCGVVAGISVIAFILTVVNWATHIQQTNAILAALGGNDINYAAIQRPEAITVRSARSVIRNEQTVDMIINIVNPNAIWAATEVTYEVAIAGKTIGPFTTLLAPNEEKFLTQLSIPFTGGSAPAVTATVLDTTWQKMADASQLPTDNWGFANPHYGYVQTAAQNAPYKTELTFTLENKSVYGFRAVDVVIELTDASGALVGLASVTLDSVPTASSRLLTFRWPLRLPIGVTPVLHVNVDRLHEDQVIRTRSQ